MDIRTHYSTKQFRLLACILRQLGRQVAVLTAHPRVTPTRVHQTDRTAEHCRHVLCSGTVLQHVQAFALHTSVTPMISYDDLCFTQLTLVILRATCLYP
jgi:hypothetical protein